MRNIIIIAVFIFANLVNAAKKQNIIAALTLDAGKVLTHYKISTSTAKSAILERTGNKIASKSIKIPTGLAESIKSELLNLSWQAQYGAKRKAASNCDRLAKIDVEAEDTVKICADQVKSFGQVKNLQRRLEKLIDSKK